MAFSANSLRYEEMWEKREQQAMILLESEHKNEAKSDF